LRNKNSPPERTGGHFSARAFQEAQHQQRAEPADRLVLDMPRPLPPGTTVWGGDGGSRRRRCQPQIEKDRQCQINAEDF